MVGSHNHRCVDRWIRASILRASCCWKELCRVFTSKYTSRYRFNWVVLGRLSISSLKLDLSSSEMGSSAVFQRMTGFPEWYHCRRRNVWILTLYASGPMNCCSLCAWLPHRHRYGEADYILWSRVGIEQYFTNAAGPVSGFARACDHHHRAFNTFHRTALLLVQSLYSFFWMFLISLDKKTCVKYTKYDLRDAFKQLAKRLL